MKVELNLTPEDLGDGFSLTYQRRTATNELRAVVKSASGEIVARGPVVPEREVARSKFMAVTEWMEAHLVQPEPLTCADEDMSYGEDEDDEDEELI